MFDCSNRSCARGIRISRVDFFLLNLDLVDDKSSGGKLEDDLVRWSYYEVIKLNIEFTEFIE